MKYRLLVVDDEMNIRETLDGLFTMRGYEVVTAPDGMMAVAAIKNYKPDLMILDVSMPRMSGFQTCQMIKKMKGYEKIPVIFLTAKKSEADKKFADRIGGDYYITKPYNQTDLVRKVEELLRKYGSANQDREDIDKIQGKSDWRD